MRNNHEEIFVNHLIKFTEYSNKYILWEEKAEKKNCGN